MGLTQYLFVFFSSRRRHTRCALVTGVQTCALPIWPVGGRNDDDAFIRFKTVHFDEELVQRLLAFIIAIAQSGTTMATDRVDFVNEEIGRASCRERVCPYV